MKAFKLLLLTLFAALGFAAQAQTIKVYKDGQVIDTFSAAQVDSVVYKQVAAIPKYYYYVGWEEISESNLATKGTLIGTSLPAKGTVIKDFIENPISYSSKSNYYVIIPENVEIWDADSNCEVGFQKYNSIVIDGYRIFISNTGSRNINAIRLVVVK